MPRVTPKTLHAELVKLAGQQAPLKARLPAAACSLLDPIHSGGLGLTQINELLLLLGFDRVSPTFFQYLVDGTTQPQPESRVSSLDQLREGVARFITTGLVLFGNVKFAFKVLSNVENEARLVQLVQLTSPRDPLLFGLRDTSVLPFKRIRADKTYLLGYLIERELQKRLLANPNDADAQREDNERRRVVKQGYRNYQAYLASDHLDVYVATSMRERHEFAAISKLTDKIFHHRSLADLKLRWFDPTQAYCGSRLDKGLAEALMLRRAECTIYLAQENDTLGKDSELASTLAQGKPVIAYVPEVDDGYVDRLLAELRPSYPDRSDAQLLLSQLRLYEPSAAWTESSVRRWVENASVMDVDAAKMRLHSAIASLYASRASTLKEDHPLGIQVRLDTGVASGILVVRSVEDCAELVRRMMTRTLELDLEHGKEGIIIRERISGCVFRLMTTDVMLTNSFWNYYLS